MGLHSSRVAIRPITSQSHTSECLDCHDRGRIPKVASGHSPQFQKFRKSTSFDLDFGTKLIVGMNSKVASFPRPLYARNGSQHKPRI